MSLEIIKELREMTGSSIGAIKKALDEARGDKAAAIEILKTEGAHMAEKKSARATREGRVISYIHGNGKIGVLLELLCETDFVARNPIFLELGREVCMQITAMEPRDIETLFDQPFIRDESMTVRDLVNKYIGKLGENIKLGNFSRFSL